MEKNKDNFQNLWYANNELIDWFSRLGGSARYDGFYISDIYLFLGVALIKHLLKNRIDIRKSDDFVSRRFLQAAEPILPIVYGYIESITFDDSTEELKFIKEFVDYSDRKLSSNKGNKSYEWQRFLDLIGRLSDES